MAQENGLIATKDEPGSDLPELRHQTGRTLPYLFDIYAVIPEIQCPASSRSSQIGEVQVTLERIGIPNPEPLALRGIENL